MQCWRHYFLIEFFKFQYHVQFDSEGIFNLEENSEISSIEGILPNVALDTNCNGAEIQYSTTKPTLEHYTACIRANFQGFITFTTHDEEEDLDDIQSCSNVKLRNPVYSSATNGCKLSVSTTTEGVKLSPISPHTFKEKKHISTSTGFLKEIIDTQEVLDKVYKSGSSKSVNFSDIKSKCDFRVATACFSNIRCLNPSVQYVRKISKENGSSNGIPADTFSTVSSDEVQLNIKVKTAKVEQWLSEVLSLLNKEYIMWMKRDIEMAGR